MISEVFSSFFNSLKGKGDLISQNVDKVQDKQSDIKTNTEQKEDGSKLNEQQDVKKFNPDKLVEKYNPGAKEDVKSKKFNPDDLVGSGKDTVDSIETKKARELTAEQKQKLKDKLGWSDKQIAKCMIDENGVILYKTDREDLEGKVSENGVPYKRKIVEINGVKVEGVFPVFYSKFDAQLPENLVKASNSRQFSECNRQLKNAVENDPELAAQFTDEQLVDIVNGDTPEGYTWHHNEKTGKMQLVKTEDHDRTQGGAAHTGGKALWGGKYE